MANQDAPNESFDSTSKAIGRLRKELAGESDRAAVLVSVAMLDEALRDLLIRKLAPNPSSIDTLFDGPSAPISSFSAKIDLAYRVGVVSARLCRDLHLFRKIRNDFAHRPAACRLDDQEVSARIEELTRSHGIFERSPKFFESIKIMPIRHKYEQAIVWILFYFEKVASRIPPLQTAAEEDGYRLSLDEEYED